MARAAQSLVVVRESVFGALLYPPHELRQVQNEWSAVKGASPLAGEDPAQGVVGTPW
jgi:hypothetical protein